MVEISIVIPALNEYPQSIFTIQAMHQEFQDVEHEILYVDNWCPEVKHQGRQPDKGHLHVNEKGNVADSVIKQATEGNPWLKYLTYDNHMSHWACKDLAIQHAQSDIILFVDAHVMPEKNSVKRAFFYYKSRLETEPLITLHLPLTYHILETKRLIYSLIYQPEKGIVHYTFCPKPEVPEPFEVPCMSSCGMFFTKDIYNLSGGFPSSMTAYGGGENITNFVWATLGIKHFIYPQATLFHHGEVRGYHSTWGGYHYNRAVATYLFGDNAWLTKYINGIDQNPQALFYLYESIATDTRLTAQRQRIVDNTKVTIEEFCEKWKH